MNNLGQIAGTLQNTVISGYDDGELLATNTNTRSSIYLRLSTIRKMLQRFLTEKEMSKEELAAVLEVTVWNLEQLFSCDTPQSRLLSKVNLPLVRLYCSTKWW